MIILVIVKCPRPTIAPVQGMIAIATHGSSRCSRHEVILTATPTRGKQIPRPNSPHASTSFTSLSGPSVNIDRVSLRRTLNVPVFSASYFLAEKNKGCVAANKNKLNWKKDDGSAKLFSTLATTIAGKQLTVKQSVEIFNPFSLLPPGLNFGEGTSVLITFTTKISIQMELYNATLQK